MIMQDLTPYLLESIYSGGLAKKADNYGVSSLTEVQKNVMLTWWAKGEIDNGGFELLYSSPVNIEEIISAFISVDANSYAKEKTWGQVLQRHIGML